MFGRKYELIVGQPITFNDGVFQAETSSVLNNRFSLADQILNTQGKSVLITEHQISFRIKRNDKGDLGNANITITNPPQNLIEHLKANSKQSPLVVLRCGYDDHYGTVFIGTVSKTSHKMEGVVREVKLTCVDGEVQTKEAYTSRVYRKGTMVSQVLEGLLEDMRMPQGSVIIPDGLDVPLKKNIVLNGKTSEQLRFLAEDLLCNYYISNGVLDFAPKFSTDPLVQTIYNLNNNSGMIGSPVPLESETDVKQDASKNVTQYTVKSLILPFIKLGDLIYIDSVVTKGAFKVIALSHQGTYEGGEWVTILDVENIKGYRIVNNEQ